MNEQHHAATVVVIFLSFVTIGAVLANGQSDYRQCLTAYSCANEIISGSFWLNCWGVGSCLGASINNIGEDDDSKSTSCSAARACQNVSRFAGTVQYESDIRGFLGLAWTKVAVTEQLGCPGEGSCYQVGNVTSEFIRCRGFRSCAGLQGRNSKEVVGNGVLSLENIILHNPLEVTLNGFYSGYNGTIYCDFGYNCTIKCKVNGCENLNLICGSINNPQNCSNSPFDENLPFVIKIDEEEDTGVSWPNINGYQLVSTSNNNNSNTGTVTDYYDRFNEILSHFSNEKIDFTMDWTTSDYSNDAYSLECTNLNDVICKDDQECSDETLSNKNNICCSAESTCVSTYLYSFNNLYCDARYSCSSSTIDGANSGNIYIRGKKSWIASSASVVQNFNTLMVTGHQSISKSEIINGSYLGCFGSNSCMNLTITRVKNIYAGGDEAMYGSEITSGGIDEMNVYFLATESGIYSSIVCSGDDTCNIYCVTDKSCDGFTRTCLDGSSCTMNVYKYTLGETETIVDPYLNPTMIPSEIPWPKVSNINSSRPTNLPWIEINVTNKPVTTKTDESNGVLLCCLISCLFNFNPG